MSKLVIVESPSKSKSLKKYLGADYDILASYGHVRDLEPKTGAVDTENFSMKYQVIERNAKHVEAIVKAAKKADEVLLATDPDREGEAISWHISEILKERKVKTPMKRVAFYEITESAIQDAVRHPREIATDLVDAQQARRALDYLVGFNLSPLLWKKVRRGLSAGRVQSVALKMICDREAEIAAFVPEEYWHLDAHLAAAEPPTMCRQSDGSTPAFSAGEPLSTPRTSAPCALPRPMASATSLLTWSICTPRCASSPSNAFPVRSVFWQFT